MVTGKEYGVRQDVIRLGRGHDVAEMPAAEWLSALKDHTSQTRAFVAGLSEFHRAVRRLVVRELPRQGGQPLTPAWIARALDAPEADVVQALADLESKLFFLVRNAEGHVAWAFPVTTDRTPHALRFSTGERLFGA